MKGPDGELANAFGCGGISSATNWGGCGEVICVFFDGGPGSIASHTETGEIDSRGIEVVVGQEVNEEDNEIVRLPAGLPRMFGEGLGRDHDEFKIVPLVHQRCEAVGFDLCDIATASAAAMEVDDERHRLFFARLLVSFREIEPETIVKIVGPVCYLWRQGSDRVAISLSGLRLADGENYQAGNDREKGRQL